MRRYLKLLAGTTMLVFGLSTANALAQTPTPTDTSSTKKHRSRKATATDTARGSGSYHQPAPSWRQHPAKTVTKTP